MTLGIRQLPMFAYKNKQVVQIRIQFSHVEAVLERWSLKLAHIIPRVGKMNAKCLRHRATEDVVNAVDLLAEITNWDPFLLT